MLFALISAAGQNSTAPQAPLKLLSSSSRAPQELLSSSSAVPHQKLRNFSETPHLIIFSKLQLNNSLRERTELQKNSTAPQELLRSSRVSQQTIRTSMAPQELLKRFSTDHQPFLRSTTRIPQEIHKSSNSEWLHKTSQLLSSSI